MSGMILDRVSNTIIQQWQGAFRDRTPESRVTQLSLDVDRQGWNPTETIVKIGPC
jgi:hypothetical protein